MCHSRPFSLNGICWGNWTDTALAETAIRDTQEPPSGAVQLRGILGVGLAIDRHRLILN